jgi:hypothetical protein
LPRTLDRGAKRLTDFTPGETIEDYLDRVRIVVEIQYGRIKMSDASENKITRPSLGLPNEVWLNDNLYVAYTDKFVMIAGARKGDEQFWVDIAQRDPSKANVLKDWVEQDGKYTYPKADLLMIASVGAHHLIRGEDMPQEA